jgi:hypothetical protein
MVQRNVPRAFAALREAAEDDALFIDFIALFDGGDPFAAVDEFAEPVF